MRISNRLILPLIALAVYSFLYLPIIVLVIFSFNNSNVLSYYWSGFTLDAYTKVFHNPELLVALKNSLIVAVSSVILSVTMGVLLVWGLFQQVGRWFSAFYITVMVPEVIIAVGLLGLFTLFNLPLGFLSLIIGHTLIGLGFVIPLIYGRMRELDTRLIEASLDLGATKWQTFRFVILPLLAPAIISASLLVFIISLDDFLISFFCAGAASQTLSLYIFSMIRAGISPEINALSTLMLLVSTILVSAFSILGNKE
jgi:spermidine/putrescine transport system permease protein